MNDSRLKQKGFRIGILVLVLMLVLLIPVAVYASSESGAESSSQTSSSCSSTSSSGHSTESSAATSSPGISTGSSVSSGSGSSTGSSETSGSPTSGSGSPEGLSFQGSTDNPGNLNSSNGLSSSSPGDSADKQAQPDSDSSLTVKQPSIDSKAPASSEEKSSKNNNVVKNCLPEESTDQSVVTPQDKTSLDQISSDGPDYSGTVDKPGTSYLDDNQDNMDDSGCYDQAADNQDGAGNSYKAEITPDGLVDGVSTAQHDVPFTITFTELNDTTKLGSAQVVINSNFTDPSFNPLTGIQASAGKTWAGELVENGGFHYLNLWATSVESYLGQNEWVSAEFSASTPAHGDRGVYEFETNAWTEAGPGFGGIADDPALENQMAAGYSNPVVTVGIGINNVDELAKIGKDPGYAVDDHYVQTSDLDLQAYLSPGGSGYNDGKGWVPIGLFGLPADIFTGSYNGRGYTISNLTINRPGEDHLGFFGYIEDALVMNVNLSDTSITGGKTVGGLAGRSDRGVIYGCSVSGTITGTENVGGLVGYNDGGMLRENYVFGSVVGTVKDTGGLVGGSINGGIITSSTAEASVNGHNNVGGLIGYVTPIGLIINSNSTGDVSGTGDMIGGLVGNLFIATILDSYATGNVSGANKVGGLVGDAFWAYINGSHAEGNIVGSGNEIGGLIGFSDAVIVDCFATGQVTGSGRVGGLLGHQEWGNITNSYASGNTFSNNSNTGGLVGYINVGNVNECYAAGSVESIVYDDTGGIDLTIENIGGLVGFLNNGNISNSHAYGDVEGTIMLEHQGDYTSDSYVGNIGGLVGRIANGDITNSTSSGKVKAALTGKIYGNLVVDSAVIESVGGLSGSSNGNITGSSSTGEVRVLAIVQVLKPEEVSLFSLNGPAEPNLSVTGHYADFRNVGGLVGVIEGSLTDCNSDVDLLWVVEGVIDGDVIAGDRTADQYATINNVGGLVGSITNGDITNCHAEGSITGVVDGHIKGDVTGSADILYAGGLVGYLEAGNVYDSSASGSFAWLDYSIVEGNVNGQVSFRHIGGLIGGTPTIDSYGLSEQNYIIANSHACSNVFGTQYVGGLVGTARFHDIENCYALGNVIGGDYTGGLVGYLRDCMVSGCYASGNVGGYSTTGGLIGYTNNVFLLDCHATGSVNDPLFHLPIVYWSQGGLVGWSTNSVIIRCYAAGDTYGATNVGGLIGNLSNSSIEESFASGNVVGLPSAFGAGGLVGSMGLPAEIKNCYATGEVTGISSTSTGGLIGIFNPEGTVKNCYAVGKVNSSNGGLIGRIKGNGDGSNVINSFYDQQTTGQNDTGKGEPKTTAEMKTLSTFAGAGWSITGEDGTYPVLWWQVDVSNGSLNMKPIVLNGASNPFIWYMFGAPEPDPEPDPGPTPAPGPVGPIQPGPVGWLQLPIVLPVTPILTAQPAVLEVEPEAPLVSPLIYLAIPPFDPAEELEPTIDADFVNQPSADELAEALALYEQYLQLFDANWETMSEQDYAYALLDLAVAWAAIQVVEVLLALEAGEEVAIDDAPEAYFDAAEKLEQHGDLLEFDQVAAAEAVLNAVESQLVMLGAEF